MLAKYLLAKELVNDLNDSYGDRVDDEELTADVLAVCLDEARKSEAQADTVLAILRAFGAAVRDR